MVLNSTEQALTRSVHSIITELQETIQADAYFHKINQQCARNCLTYLSIIDQVMLQDKTETFNIIECVNWSLRRCRKIITYSKINNPALEQRIESLYEYCRKYSNSNKRTTNVFENMTYVKNSYILLEHAEQSV
ncbi:hypothetical protein GJ496_000376 [Pomphorhynchus laevis]|nr:hypothetical protein GJ496_000376 [Pomphorhynchus laevis]